MRAPIGLAVLLATAAGLASEKRVVTAADAKTLFERRCSACHAPDRVHHRNAGRGEWREIVFRMQRMPHSGISPREAGVILDYIVSLGSETAPPAPVREGRLGGAAAYGKEWLSILETATVRGGKARLGGRVWTVRSDGLAAHLSLGKKSLTVALDAKGRPATTARVDGWKIGEYAYEVHVVLYEIHGPRIRLARALKRTP